MDWHGHNAAISLQRGTSVKKHCEAMWKAGAGKDSGVWKTGMAVRGLYIGFAARAVTAGGAGGAFENVGFKNVVSRSGDRRSEDLSVRELDFNHERHEICEMEKRASPRPSGDGEGGVLDGSGVIGRLGRCRRVGLTGAEWEQIEHHAEERRTRRIGVEGTRKATPPRPFIWRWRGK